MKTLSALEIQEYFDDALLAWNRGGSEFTVKDTHTSWPSEKEFDHDTDPVGSMTGKTTILVTRPHYDIYYTYHWQYDFGSLTVLPNRQMLHIAINDVMHGVDKGEVSDMQLLKLAEGSMFFEIDIPATYLRAN